MGRTKVPTWVKEALARGVDRPVPAGHNSGRGRLLRPKPWEGKGAMIDLYYWPTPNGWKLTILFEELGIPYNVIPVDINKGEQFEADFLAIAPNNRMPAVVDPEGADGKPLSLFESGAIMLHYADKHGRFIAADERGRAEVLQWLFFQMGNVGPMLGQCHHFSQLRAGAAPLRGGALHPTRRAGSTGW